MSNVYNLCSLEHCYTNLFALTDLKGIKWLKLRVRENQQSVGSYLEDPILQTYSRCLGEDILCAWKRTKASMKELWIFFYEKEPQNLRSQLLAKCLEEKENGSWDNNNTSGLSYECRIMLFKALHNMIEKCLLQKGFARLSKWFLMPYEQSTAMINDDSGNHVSYSFSFFLHGTSRVCTSVDVKLHKPIRYINKYDLVNLNKTIRFEKLCPSSVNNKALISQLYLNVILSPYSLSGYLIGYLTNDSEQSKKILEEWKKYYPIRTVLDENGLELPRVLSILMVPTNNKNYRLFYPACYVYTLISEDETSDDTEDDRRFKSNNKENKMSSKNDAGQRMKLEVAAAVVTASGIQLPSKKLDSLDLTIDSVARNGPTTPNISPTASNKTSSPLTQKTTVEAKSRMNLINRSEAKIRKLKKQLTCLKTLNSNVLINKILSSSNKSSMKNCLNMRNQINLKHQTIELIQENVELAYDIVNKACSCFLQQNYLHSNEAHSCTCGLKTNNKQIAKAGGINGKPKLFHHRKSNFRLKKTGLQVNSSKKRLTFNQFYEQKVTDVDLENDESDVEDLNDDGVNVDSLLSIINSDSDSFTSSNDEDGDNEEAISKDQAAGLLSEVLSDFNSDDDAGDDNLASLNKTTTSDNLFYDLNNDNDLIDMDIRTLMLPQPAAPVATAVIKLQAPVLSSSSPSTLSSSPSSVSSNDDDEEDAQNLTRKSITGNMAKLNADQKEKLKGYNTNNKYQITYNQPSYGYGKPVYKRTTDAEQLNADVDFDSLYNYNFNATTRQGTDGGDLISITTTTTITRNFAFPNMLNVNSPLNLISNSSSPVVAAETLPSMYNNADDSQQPIPQITPPQSVENPGSVDGNKQQRLKSLNSAGPAVNTANISYTLNPNPIKAASYEDLTYLFEDETDDSAVAAQQQQDAGGQSTAVTVAQSNQQAVVSTNAVNKQAITTHLIDYSSCNMIVMTPPSHENIELINILQQQQGNSQHSDEQQQQQQQQQPAHQDSQPMQQLLNNITNSNEVFLSLNESLFSLKSKLIYEIPHVNNYLTSKKYSKLPQRTNSSLDSKSGLKYPKWSSSGKNQSTGTQTTLSYQQFKQQKQQQQIQQQQLQQQKLAKLKSTPTLSSLFASNGKQPSFIASTLGGNDFISSPLSSSYRQPPTPAPISRTYSNPMTPVMPAVASPYMNYNNVANEIQQPLSVMSSYVDSPASQHSTLNTSMKNTSFVDHQQQQQQPPTPLYSHQHLQQQAPHHQQQQQQIPFSNNHHLNKSQSLTTNTVATQLANTPTLPFYSDLNSLSYNVYLSDTVLNVYRDTNFDSCTLCVCNNTIKGIDYLVYIVDDGINKNGASNANNTSLQHLNSVNADQYSASGPPCSCGFSSIVNRKLAYNSGLFYEDFIEIVGVKYESRYSHKKPLPGAAADSKLLPNSLIELIESKYSSPFLTFYEHLEIYSSIKTNDVFTDLVVNANKTHFKKYLIQQQQQQDGSLNQDEDMLCLNAIQNIADDESAANPGGDATDDEDLDEEDEDFDYEKQQQMKKRKLKATAGGGNTLQLAPSFNICNENLEVINHNWLLNKKELKSNIELTKYLKYMQPLLEEALQKKHTSRSWESVQGPMTWQHFCRISFRDNSTSSSLPLNLYEPEPIPALLVSSTDRDWLCVSPYAIKFWDKLNIEPYSKQKNIAYVVLCPDVDMVIKNTKSYFKELNSIYEMCHLGAHKAARRLGFEGIVKIPMKEAANNSEAAPDADGFFKNISAKSVGVKLKNYTNACKNLSMGIKHLIKYDTVFSDDLLRPVKLESQRSTSQHQHQQQQPHSNQQQSNVSLTQLGLGTASTSNELDFHDFSPHTGLLLDDASLNNLTGSNDDFLLNSQNQTTYAPFTTNYHDAQQYQQQQQHAQSSIAAQQQQHQQQQQQQVSAAAAAAASSSSVLNPTLVIYMIDPFDYANIDSTDEFDGNECKRIVTLGLFKAYLELVQSIPEKIRHKVVFQVVPLQIIMDLCVYSDDDFKLNMLRSQAFNIFSLIKRNYTPSIPRAKTMTGFGPAALEEKFIRESQKLNFNFNNKYPNFYSPPFILAPCTTNSLHKSLALCDAKAAGASGAGSSQANASGQSNAAAAAHQNSTSGHNESSKKRAGANETIGSNVHMQQFLQLNSLNQEQCSVLYAGYCLSDDQRYLLVSCCDENGEFLESTAINIEVSERHRRKQQHARRVGLRKLWEFVLTIIAQTCKPWRIVVGRLGRLGHSELRAWGCLLSKKNLQRSCLQLKELCENCSLLGNTEMPCILSACLISMEACSSICIYPESFSREDKTAAGLSASANPQAQGVSTTHILTFPASAIIQTTNTTSTKDDPMKPMPMDDDFFMDLFNFEDAENNEFNDILMEDAHNKGNESAIVDSENNNSKQKMESLLNQEEAPHLDQQPLAVGYYLSTAKCGPLPRWLRGESSTDANYHTFKATLHIHNPCALESDDLVMQVKTDHTHRLDSIVTYEVLRYVLERYNALSWLTIDPLTQDRKSCLPLHHSVLLQLYHAFSNFI